MTLLKFKIKLVSDATPSSGFGTEFIDALITRNANGIPIIRASHIKGIMRQTISDTLSVLGHTQNAIINNVFGSGADPNTAALFSLTDATLVINENYQDKQFIISKTKINKYGVAEIGSLRTSEFISSGSEFAGTCYLSVEKDSIEDLVMRFSLLSIDAFGGSRTRGAGACIVTIENETRTPGCLVKKLYEKLSAVKEETTFKRVIKNSVSLSDSIQLFKVIFNAETPVCCPESPVKTNQINSGFSIPASAVQGAILHRLNSSHPEIASACFNTNRFRAWPLQPTINNEVNSVRVSLTHKIDKNAKPLIKQNFWFTDTAIHEDWRNNQPSGSSLKSSDGVLLSIDDGLQIWKDSGIPRVVSIHNKVNSRSKGLFSMESIAPITWCGYLAIPKDAAEILVKSVEENNFFSFGKKRSIQGGGFLKLEKIDGFNTSTTKETFLITQSPLLFNYNEEEPLEDSFMKLVTNWAEKHALPKPDKVWADAGIRFGWNRHNLGKTVGDNGRLQALPVILPGAVVKFNTKINNDILKTALIAGIGEGKQRGYGAALLHPGVAEKIYKKSRKLKKVKSDKKEALVKAIKIAKLESLPSASQLSPLLKKNREDAITFLQEQKRNRGIKFYLDLVESFDEILDLLKTEGYEIGLKYLINESIARRKEN